MTRFVRSLLIVAGCLMLGVLTWAQDPSVDIASYDALGPAADTLAKAITGHASPMVILGAALAVIIQILKLPALGGLAFKVPSWARFWIPAVVGAVYGIIEKVNAGSLWGSAVAGAVTVLMSAVTTRRAIETHGGDVKKADGPK
jgi:hypothetical protein